MNELQRQRYLSALGIDSFIPRLILPWARPSTACELPLPPVTATPLVNQSVAPVSSNLAPAVSSHTGAAETVGKVLREMDATKPTAVRKEPLKAVQPKPQPVLQALHLHLWRPAEGLIVIDHFQPGAALPTDSLLHNMLRLLWPSESRVEPAELIRFPLGDQPADRYSRDQMQVELQVWFSEELKKSPSAQVWLLGAEAAKYVIIADEKTQQNSSSAGASQKVANQLLHFKRHPLMPELELATNANALVLPSLTEMLRDPELKNKLWVAVQGNA